MSAEGCGPVYQSRDVCSVCGRPRQPREDRVADGAAGADPEDESCTGYHCVSGDRMVPCPWGSGFVAVTHGKRYGYFSGGPLLPHHKLTSVGKQHHVVRVPGTHRPGWVTKYLRRTVVLAASVVGWIRVRDVEPECAHLIEQFAWVGSGARDDLIRAHEVAQFNAPRRDEEEMYERLAGVPDAQPF